MGKTVLELTDLDPSEDPLWARIEAYEFDVLDPQTPFVARLGRENLWPVDYAERVLEEYRRFCYLAVRAPHPVAPSDAVDRVWHLHLCYSRQYWEDWCGRILGCDLHHAPTGSDGDDTDQCRDWYEATLRAYQIVSGEPPPPDIWPDAAIRFGGSGTVHTVSSAEYLIVRRPPKGILWAVQLLLILTGLFLLWEEQFTSAVVVGGLAGALAVYRDRTDNVWKKKPWRDGDDDGFLPGGCNARQRDRRDM